MAMDDLTEQMFTTAQAPPGSLESIRRLLEDAFVGDFSQDDWEHTLGGWHVVIAEADVALAHAAVVPRTLEISGRPFRSGYVEGVATAPHRQCEGLGTLAMSRLGEVLRSRFDVGFLSTSRHAFYERLGWERWRGPTFVRRHGELLRTEEEDTGIMVLRFGTSLQLDVTGAVVCEARTGDDW